MKKHKNKNKNSNQSGFTLIELLVVVSIISMLASILLVSVRNAEIKGADTRRIADLNQLQNALEFYYQDHGHYPITRCGAGFAGYLWASPDNNYDGHSAVCDVQYGPATAANINAALAPYMNAITDPSPNQSTPLNGHWYESSDGTWYRYQIVGDVGNMSDIPTQYVDTMLCGLPILTNGGCSPGGTDPILGTLGYSWINTIMITSDPTKTNFQHGSGVTF